MSNTAQTTVPSVSKAARFGTFAGVFVPNVLTILGIILFLRTGWVVGQAGLIQALLIVVIANLISFLTGLSLSAVATAMQVRAGGKYYIISRSLGLEIGGAIGIPLYLSQAISVAFYIIGFTEAIQALAFFQQFDPRLIATVVALIFGAIAFIGADFAIKIQYFILAALMAALLSFFTGGWDAIQTPVLTPHYTEGMNFWTVFAVFFPAVTGIAVGASMSGDLKDPSKSIPRGTIVSILFTAVIYLAAVIWLSMHGSPEELIQNTLIMHDIARVPVLIFIGVWSATLSSALGSIVAAPRTLQAIARDRIVPRWLASQLGSPTEPRMAVLLSTAIAVGVIWAGDLNFVAPIITMFFLNTYGMMNLVAGIEKLVGNPSFRPRFNIHWSLSLAGALGCYGTMFLINPFATVAAVVISYGIYFFLQRRAVAHTWGDVRNGIWFALARWALLNLETKQYHAKNWRPNILVFTGQPHNRQHLADVAEWLSRGQGIVSFFQLIAGDVEQLSARNLRAVARRQIRAFIFNRNMTAFPEADIVPDFFTGAVTVAQSHGVGGLEPNTVLLGWSGSPQGRRTLMRLLTTLVNLEKSVLFLHHDDLRGVGRRQVIDVWWRGRSQNGELMLLLAYIISRHPSWEGAQIRLRRVLYSEEGRSQTEAHLRSLLADVRVDAEPQVIVASEEEPFAEIVRRQSRDADLTLLGMARPVPEEMDAYAERLDEFVRSVGTVLLVHSAHEEELLQAGE
ncbi:MAG: amino acid permease [Caldilineae bacterium]|nr:MAG: amino acid permease [Caldilineae bacterium]